MVLLLSSLRPRADACAAELRRGRRNNVAREKLRGGYETFLRLRQPPGGRRLPQERQLVQCDPLPLRILPLRVVRSRAGGAP